MSFFNYSSTLYSSLSTSGFSSFSSLLGEYNQIRNGSYGRLLKAYYSKYNADGTAKSSGTDTKKDTSKVKTSSDTVDSAKSLNAVAEKATTLQKAAIKLAAVKEGSSSLYAKKTIVDTKEDGTTSTRTDYDYDTLVNAVKSLVSAYNDTLDGAGSVASSSVQQKTKWVMDATNQHKDTLSAIGITTNKDGRLVFDEETFRSADMLDIQDALEGSNSFTGLLARKASNLAGAAELQASRAASAYTASGNSYTDTMNSGSIFDSLF